MNGTSAASMAAATSSRASRHVLSCAENSTSPDRVQPDFEHLLGDIAAVRHARLERHVGWLADSRRGRGVSETSLGELAERGSPVFRLVPDRVHVTAADRLSA